MLRGCHRYTACALKDCASNRIVGYAIDSGMTSELGVNALRMAIIALQPDRSHQLH